MFLLDSQHVKMGKCSTQKSCLFMIDAWFLKIILLAYGFCVAVAKAYIIPQKTLFDPIFMLVFWIEFSENDEVLKS